MRPITWLHISDIHMQLRDEWSQDVVLRAMCESIERKRDQDGPPDFVLATGDLAFSGRAEEYKLVMHFLDAISTASGVPADRIFCIPGNHDVNRDLQKLCFHGARAVLTSENLVDPLLAPDDNLATLAQRQEGYRTFQETYFAGQRRTVTPDGLAYVSTLTIDDVVIALVGLNSSWLADGGEEDHGKLLIGERQVLNGLGAAEKSDPHIVIAMAHHPLHLLREFDRTAVTNRVNQCCHFFHCGHLHQPEASGAGFSASGCLTEAAGASFETRAFRNTYSIVKVSLAEATRKTTTVQFDPTRGAFVYAATDEFPIQLRPAASCSVSELAEAIAAFESSLAPYAYYLAALLLDQKAELPVPSANGHVLGTLAVLQRQPEDAFCRKTVEFIRFKNCLSVFCGRMPLGDLLARNGEAVRIYGKELIARCQADHALGVRITDQDADVRGLIAAQPKVSFTEELFADLVASQDLELLLGQAKRHLESPDPAVVTQARRMMAFALANGSADTDKTAAIALLQALTQEDLADFRDYGNLATLLSNSGQYDDAKAVVLTAIAVSPKDKMGYLDEIGQRLVVQTGDKVFRTRLLAAIAERGSHD